MATNIKVSKSGNENTGAILRKFTQRARSAGLVKKMRKIRYRSRPLSKSVQKKEALRRIRRREEFERRIKEGKLSENIRGKRVKWDKN